MKISSILKHFILAGFLIMVSLQASTLEDGNTAAQKGNMSSALKHWEKACEEGSFAGCQNAARVYDFADGVKEDDLKALSYYTKACDVGYSYSCARLALIYEENKVVEQDTKKAFKLYTKACGGGDMFACHNVAVSYGKEKSEQNQKISINFYKLACEGGYADSCIYLGRLYRDSRVVDRDYKKAKEYFSLACEENNRLGCKEVRILEGAGY